MGLRYDLHIHSALSPCADNDMTPATIAGLCKLAGLDIIALADHNSARNLPAAKMACDFYGLKLLPAIETNTAEEIHLLCYFPTVATALDMGELIYASLPDMPVDPEIWGDQLVLDENDEVIGRVDRLLTAASDLDIYRMTAACRDLGGIAVPAHADRDAYSVLSVLGLFPDDLGFTMTELRHPGYYEGLCEMGVMPPELEILFSSDAHRLDQLCRESIPELNAHSGLFSLIEKL